ncbi:tryptophan 7-halogenase [Pseudoalteromonas sp. NEC-BIFX-2020_002]|nr:tryptophan halogenase family protein [Pseudoalteromonas sp. NEC-BIFX-2020_002]NNG42873.1 tryptophan 7-halogenase [Pseudoalteromonas sp. NEC-BIFX-2020_002]
MDPKVAKIIIVGGGSAGWMAANSLLSQLNKNLDITLVESETIGTIGVGEGSTPYLKEYFRALDIPESEWMPACNATYKAGINFVNWSTVKGYENYFHPFFSQFDLKPAKFFFNNCNKRRLQHNANAHPNHYFVAAHLASLNYSPIVKEKVPFDVDYGYHFDSVKLGLFLKRKAQEKNINHIISNITEVNKKDNGDISSITTDCGKQITGDFFIDCSGFAALLVNKTQNRHFVSYADTLLNDSAVAIQTPLNSDEYAPPLTISKALKYGWSWQIPLANRWGNGYVYSSQFITPEDAEAELREELGLTDTTIKAKHLKMRVGRLDEHWRGNCLAVGLSQGFIEPLEATALMLIQLTIEKFIQVNSQNTTPSIENINTFNTEINTTFDGVRDYILAHYKLNTRSDTPYWRHCRENINETPSLATILNAWDSELNFEDTLAKNKSQLVYLKPSWYCILAGMGRFPEVTKADYESNAQNASEYCKSIVELYFLKNKEQLNTLYNK